MPIPPENPEEKSPMTGTPLPAGAKEAGQNQKPTPEKPVLHSKDDAGHDKAPPQPSKPASHGHKGKS